MKPTESGDKNRKRKNESPVPESKSKKRTGDKPRSKKRSQDVDLTKGKVSDLEQNFSNSAILSLDSESDDENS